MDPALGLLWAKSDTTAGRQASPRPHLLLGHMIDSAQVAGVLWDEHLAESVKLLVRSITDGSDKTARRLVQFLAGVHDLGKASPAFQSKSTVLFDRLRQSTGIDVCMPGAAARGWHHTLAGGAAIKELLSGTPWGPHAEWIRAMVGGHHGIYVSRGDYRVRYDVRAVHGQDDWDRWRLDLVLWLLRELEIISPSGDLRDLPNWLAQPPVAMQVILEGLVIQSDWIASDGHAMPGLWELERISAETARMRAQLAVADLRFSPGWALPLLDNVFAARFGFTPRPVQAATEAAVTAMDSPGLIIVEAPMGEGKTEAALAAAELMGRRFGAHGVFVGLPTQATTDAMFSRVKGWLERVQPGGALGLSHGKSVVNAEYAGLDDWHATEVGTDCGCDVYSPSQWFTGRKRLLLTPHIVGTIDNVLLAGAQVRHVALHHLAFAQKVVVLDEVHAVDVYMSEFLDRALEWLGASHVPVVLLSATLPDSLRRRLIRAYTGEVRQVEGGYPQITTATPTATAVYTPPASTTKIIKFDVLDEPGLRGRDTTDADNDVIALLRDRLADGGCALIIRNTVARAQSLYSALKAAFPTDPVLLLHSRFTAGDRAMHTDELLRLLGDTSERTQSNHPVIVVATQVAEQSLDIDADILITDLCPVDLLLQRAGRLHRHAANDPTRPIRLRAPTVVVTRMRDATTAAADGNMGLPTSPAGFVYPMALLARTAQLLYRTPSLMIPGDVPAVITEVFEPEHHCSDNPLWHNAFRQWDDDRSWENGVLQVIARNAALNPRGASVDGLNLFEHDAERVMVRAGELPLEIALLQSDSDGLLHGVGSDITFHPDGTPADALDVADIGARVIASTVRISNRTLIAALCNNPSLPEWKGHPWLHGTGVLILNSAGAATVPTDFGSLHIAYDHELGLTWNT